MKSLRKPKNLVVYLVLILALLVGSMTSVKMANALAQDPPSEPTATQEPTLPLEPTVEPTLPPEPTFEPTAEMNLNEYRLEPYYSEDGKVVYNAGQVLLLMDDKNPNRAKNRIPAVKGLRKTSHIDIDYLGNGDVDKWGKDCLDFPADVITAMEYSRTLWESTINSLAPIEVLACWSDQLDADVLGYSGGQIYYVNFSDDAESDIWYPSALANAIVGSDMDIFEYDMHITFNSTFSWYTGTDANPGTTEHDLVTVSTHEIGHGLGFSGSAYAYETAIPGVFKGKFGITSLSDGNTYPVIYDTFMESATGKLLTDFDSPSYDLADLLRSQSLWWNGPKANLAYGGSDVPMYAPIDWDDGSSYVHLDYVWFNDTDNELMVYATGAGEATHIIGPVVKGLLMDIGWSRPKPPPPALISPTGTIYSLTPTYKWALITDATKYKFQLFSGSSKIHELTLGCTSNPCSYKPTGVTLDYKLYKWRVMAYANGKWSDYSPYLNFSVTVKPPTAKMPSGDIYNRKPAYEWTGISGATTYHLTVRQSSFPFDYEIQTDYNTTAVCVGTTCKVTPNVLLDYRDYDWSVSAYKDEHWSDASNHEFFKILVTTPTPKTPSGNIYTAKPTYKWATQEYVTNYQIQVDSASAVTLKASNICSAGWCSYTPTTALSYADHKWKLKAQAESVWSAWSAEKKFKVIGPSTPTSPDGNIYTREPTYRWTPVTGATQYRFQVFDGTTMVDEQTVSSAYCTTSACEYKPISKVLAYKTHSWKVQAYAASAWQIFSTSKSFTVINPISNPNSPTGDVYDNTPTFKWSKISGATQYRFQVYKGTSSTLLYTKTITSSSCDTTSCSNTPSDTLTYNTQHKWRVQAYAGGAWQTYSSYLSFYPRTSIPVLQSPSGNTYDQTPHLKWFEVYGADEYEVQVRIQDSIDPILIFTYHVSKSFCSDGVCSKLSDELGFSDFYNWRVRAKVGGGWKSWSSATNFKIINPVPWPIEPKGILYTDNPLFTWVEVPGATQYTIEIYYMDTYLFNQVHVTDPSCFQGVCSYQLEENLYPAYHDYRWHIQALAGGYWYSYSEYRDFNYIYLEPGVTTRISIDDDGNEFDNHSLYPSISANGHRIAYQVNYYDGYNTTRKIYLYDLDKNTTVSVSDPQYGSWSSQHADNPKISGNGFFIAFDSESEQMVFGDTNGFKDVFLHDTQNDTRVLVSVNSNEVQGNGNSYNPFISLDGNYVMFTSDASNLVEEDTNGVPDVFVRNISNGNTVRVSVSSSGQQGNSVSFGGSITSNGNYIVFESSASNLVTGDTNGVSDIFVHNISTGATTRASIAVNGITQPDAYSYSPSISDDGLLVSYYTEATTLVPGDYSYPGSFFLKNMTTGTVTRISVPKTMPWSDGSAEISRNGSTIIFSTRDDRQIGFGNDTNSKWDVFAYNIATGVISLVSMDSDGAQGNGDSSDFSVSSDGSWVAFFSYASNLVENDLSGYSDIFLHIR